MESTWVLEQVEFLAAVIIPAVALAGVSRRPIPAPRCASCAYDLTGLSHAAPCPECSSPHRGRRGPFWAPQTWSYAPRRAAWSLGLVPIALGAALAMPIIIGALWDLAHAVLAPSAAVHAVTTLGYGEMHICFSLAYIGAFALATVPLARLPAARAFAAATALLTLGAGVQLCYLAADSISGHLWWADALNRQRFVFAVFALVLASLIVAAVDPALRGEAPKRCPSR